MRGQDLQEPSLVTLLGTILTCLSTHAVTHPNLLTYNVDVRCGATRKAGSLLELTGTEKLL